MGAADWAHALEGMIGITVGDGCETKLRSVCGARQLVGHRRYKWNEYDTSAFLILAIPYDQVEGFPFVRLYDFFELCRIKVVGQRVALEADDEIEEGFNVGLGGWRRRGYTKNMQGLRRRLVLGR